MSEWKDISSAPRDGTEVDLWLKDANGSRLTLRATDCAWKHLADGPDWYTRGEKGWEPLGALGLEATHWMPIPESP